MGINGLNKVIKQTTTDVIKYVSIESLPKGLYGVDVSGYIYAAKYNAMSKGKGSHIRMFLDMIMTWRKAGHGLIMIFDGDTHSIEEKAETILKRSEQRNKKIENLTVLCSEISQGQETESSDNLIQNATELLNHGMGTMEQQIELERALRNNVIIEQTDFEDLRKLFDLTNTEYLCSKGEADHLLADLFRSKKISGVISEDSDMLTHGVEVLIRGLIDAKCRSRGEVMVYNLKQLLREWGLTYKQFVDVCILSGSDYCPKIKGIACKTAITAIKKYGSVTEILKNMKLKEYPPDGYLERYQRAYQIFSDFSTELPSIRYRWERISSEQAEKLKIFLRTDTNYTESTIDRKLEYFKTVELVLNFSFRPRPLIRLKDKNVK